MKLSLSQSFLSSMAVMLIAAYPLSLTAQEKTVAARLRQFNRARGRVHRDEPLGQ